MSDKNVANGRRNFIKKGVAGLAGVGVLPAVLKGKEGAPAVKKTKMVYRTLGKTGIKVPIVSMGVMNADNPNLVRAALDAGIVHLDTAWYYQQGRNEEMIGKVVKDRPRDSYVLATKVWEPRDRKTGLYPKDAKPDTFLEKFETSLKRLDLDYVDILYLHSVPRKESALFEPYLKTMQKLKKEGRTKFIGVSTHTNEPEVIRAAADSGVYDVVLTAYNFKQKHWREVKDAIGYAAQKGLGVVAMKTQAGVYWDKEKQYPINMKAALKWVLQDENVHTTIPGFTTFDQLNLDLEAMAELTLTPQEKLDLKFGQEKKLSGLYCRQCGQCVEQCRRGLDIPSAMRSYMYAYGYKNLAQARETLLEAALPEDACKDCGGCPVECATKFDVRERITDIARLKRVPGEFLA